MSKADKKSEEGYKKPEIALALEIALNVTKNKGSGSVKNILAALEKKKTEEVLQLARTTLLAGKVIMPENKKQQLPVKAATGRIKIKPFKKMLLVRKKADLDILTLSNEGLRFVKLKRYQDAEEKFKAALAINPVEPNVLGNLGGLYMEQQRWADAIDYYTKAIAAGHCAPNVLQHNITEMQRRLFNATTDIKLNAGK